jgi:hypothetical protein
MSRFTWFRFTWSRFTWSGFTWPRMVPAGGVLLGLAMAPVAAAAQQQAAPPNFSSPEFGWVPHRGSFQSEPEAVGE